MAWIHNFTEATVNNPGQKYSATSCLETTDPFKIFFFKKLIQKII